MQTEEKAEVKPKPGEKIIFIADNEMGQETDKMVIYVWEYQNSSISDNGREKIESKEEH